MSAIITPQQLGASVVVAASNSKETWRASWDQTLGRYLQCDGDADEVEINAAIAAVVAAGGGEVFLLDGTYTVDASITITSSSVTLSGTGRPTIITTDVADVDIIACSGGITDIILRDFMVDGNAGGAANDIGISWNNVDMSKIINVVSKDNGEYGIYLINCDNDELEGIICNTNTLSGLFMETCTWVKISDPICSTNVESGITMSLSTDCQLVAPTCNGNDSGDTDTYDGIYVTNSDRTTVIGAACDANDRHGLMLQESSYCSIVGGEFNNNGGDGIHIAGDAPNADYNTIVGVVCTGNTSDGIEISEVGAGDSNKNIIVGCQLTGNTGAAITDAGTGTVTGHNVTV